MQNHYQHAIVIGGSITGLLAGRILANHYRKVTILERDHYPDSAGPRKGAPQARHIHVLLSQGQEVLERFFPGLVNELLSEGAQCVDWTQDCVMLTPNGQAPRFRSGVASVTCTRDLLEWTLYQRLGGYANVHFSQGMDTTGLIENPKRYGTAGVRARRRGQTGPEGQEQELYADLVVDASGRSSRLPEWLKALGYPAPRDTIVNSFQGYASRWFRIPAGLHPDWKIVLIANPPEHSRKGGIYTVEGERWVVTLAGAAQDAPPTDEAGFLAYAQSLSQPDLYKIIKDAEPISPVYGFKRTENRLRHYERLARWPEGLIAMGDAVCTFNPVYGQGMTAAALDAVALNETLQQAKKSPGSHLGRDFQKRLAKVNAPIWMMATSEDFRWPTTVGKRPNKLVRLMQLYMDQVLMLTGQHNDVRMTFLRVAQLIDPPIVFFRPGIFMRVVKRLLNPPPRPAKMGRS